jgi:hypothetical protein
MAAQDYGLRNLINVLVRKFEMRVGEAAITDDHVEARRDGQCRASRVAKDAHGQVGHGRLAEDDDQLRRDYQAAARSAPPG